MRSTTPRTNRSNRCPVKLDHTERRYRGRVSKQALAVLLALWCVLVVAPGLIAVLAFGNAAPEDPVTGGIFAVWIVGYLVQFGVWFVISTKSKRNNMLGWFLASIVPWAACWSAPVSLWWLIPCLAVVGGYATFFHRSFERSDELQRNGIPALGTVLEVKSPLLNTVINDVYILRTLRLRIQRSDGAPPYDALYKGTFMIGNIPSPGESLRLKVDPRNPKHLESADDADADDYLPANRAVPASDFESTAGSTIPEQLQHLADLHRRGDLTDQEYAEAKRRVLGGT
jgi:hypothetical protein